MCEWYIYMFLSLCICCNMFGFQGKYAWAVHDKCISLSCWRVYICPECTVTLWYRINCFFVFCFSVIRHEYWERKGHCRKCFWVRSVAAWSVFDIKVVLRLWSTFVHLVKWLHDLVCHPTDVMQRAMPCLCAWTGGKGIVGNVAVEWQKKATKKAQYWQHYYYHVPARQKNKNCYITVPEIMTLMRHREKCAIFFAGSKCSLGLVDQIQNPLVAEAGYKECI